ASFSQRSSGLDIMAPGAILTSTFLHGGFQSMAGTSMASPVVAGAAVLLHQALDATGQSALANEDYILARMQATGVNVIDGDDENDNVVNTGLTFKRLDVYAALNSIATGNRPPVLAPIANQTMKVSDDKITVALSASDPDNKPLTFSAQLASPWTQAWQLRQQLGLTYMGAYYTTFQGHNEKWLQGADAQYFLLPNGELRRWHDAPYSYGPAGLIATLDPRFYADPSLLWNAAGPPVLTVTGNQLTIDPPAGFAGTFSVRVTVSDGSATATGTFSVTVMNTPPVLGSLPNVSMSPSQDKLTVPLSASDADGDALTWTAALAGQATQYGQLRQQLGLTFSGSYSTNFQGHSEKCLQGKDAQYFLLPNGEPRRWQNANYSYGPAGLVATLDASVYADPSLLWNALSPSAVSLSGNQLTIDPPAGYLGSFTVAVTVSDGMASVAGS